MCPIALRENRPISFALPDFPLVFLGRRPERRDGGEVTELLRAWSGGEATAFERVLPLVYDELHRMAARYLAGERSSLSFQATELVNELCVRLLGWDPIHW